MKFLSIIALFLTLSAQAWAALPDRYVVVPNRSDSSLTLVATPQGTVLQKVTEQDTGFAFEPLYAASLPRFHMVSVSDRKNSRLLFFDSRDFRYLGHVPTSQGLFHMWPTPEQKEILVSADIDRVVDVVEINRFNDQVVFKKRQLNPGALFSSGKP
ncbi:MAG: hypothetical protein KDD33_10775, partial [Bdellovibrionales bacterium]|nr:hypothetical protein [Bdellovibrionales bacterium]